MNLRFARQAIADECRCWLAWLWELWNRWEPKNTWREWLRLTLIESTLALAIIWLGQAIF